ncbi:MAG: choice-of-anchor L domain-containing protein [Deltaproteobacteria bacterium]|nr:choice-of-anchor L domain-containing protein [Deltaproteobacteria bacterium]
MGPGLGESGGATAATSASTAGESEDAGVDESSGDVKLDVGDGQGNDDDGGNVACDEDVPTPTPCDGDDDDPLHAIGVNCDPTNGVAARGAFDGPAGAMEVMTQTLGDGTYSAREGDKYLVLSTGVAAQITQTPAMLCNVGPGGGDDGPAPGDPEDPEGADPMTINCPSTDLPGPALDELPAPLNIIPVDPLLMTTCEDDDSLVGTGDCSNTLWQQWQAARVQGGLGATAHDYAEVRLTIPVPEDKGGIGFDFAFMSVEYPDFYKSEFNDMFVAWVESERWTGNISFDDQGNPISVNAGFLDYKDAPNDYDCPDCTAPELHGFAAQGHGATRWLTSSTQVQPGEDLTVVFSIFDLSDGELDSLVLIDNVHWTCAGAPTTTPVG